MIMSNFRHERSKPDFFKVVTSGLKKYETNSLIGETDCLNLTAMAERERLCEILPIP
jgi:hypothetical protein